MQLASGGWGYRWGPSGPESLGAYGRHAATAIASLYRGQVARTTFQSSLKTARSLPQAYLEKPMTKGSSMQGKADSIMNVFDALINELRQSLKIDILIAMYK